MKLNILKPKIDGNYLLCEAKHLIARVIINPNPSDTWIEITELQKAEKEEEWSFGGNIVNPE